MKLATRRRGRWERDCVVSVAVFILVLVNKATRCRRCWERDCVINVAGFVPCVVPLGSSSRYRSFVVRGTDALICSNNGIETNHGHFEIDVSLSDISLFLRAVSSRLALPRERRWDGSSGDGDVCVRDRGDEEDGWPGAFDSDFVRE